MKRTLQKGHRITVNQWTASPKLRTLKNNP